MVVLLLFDIIFDASFLGASAPFDADGATVKLRVFVGATLVRPVTALAPVTYQLGLVRKVYKEINNFIDRLFMS